MKTVALLVSIIVENVLPTLLGSALLLPIESDYCFMINPQVLLMNF